MYNLKDTGEWERNTPTDGNGSSGGCDECGHFDEKHGGLDDVSMLDFYADVESASLILCPACYHAARAGLLADALCQAVTALSQTYTGPMKDAIVSIGRAALVQADTEAR